MEFLELVCVCEIWLYELCFISAKTKVKLPFFEKYGSASGGGGGMCSETGGVIPGLNCIYWEDGLHATKLLYT